MLRDTFVRVLEHRCKLIVFAAGDLAGARRLAFAQRPDVTLVDLGLPDGHGFTLISELRALNIGVRHFLVSSHNTTDTTVAAMRAGATNVLDKPIRADDLVGQVMGTDPAPAPPAFHTIDRLQWNYVQHAYTRCGRNKSEAARRLGIDRKTLDRWLAQERPAT